MLANIRCHSPRLVGLCDAALFPIAARSCQSGLGRAALLAVHSSLSWRLFWQYGQRYGNLVQSMSLILRTLTLPQSAIHHATALATKVPGSTSCFSLWLE